MKIYSILLACFYLMLIKASAQNCPENIGFEDGTFKNWQSYIGNIDRTGNITVTQSTAVSGRHTVIKYASNQLDPYGKFPMTCPNGSLYSMKLGNDGTGMQAERVSYTFTVPNNQTYSIIYNYAVVFQNPDHAEYEQPKFTARVFDVASNKYVSCGSFEFVASSGLPGFQQSAAGGSVFYKPWAPITINLFGYAGKTLRLEFTTNDCTRGGHFGYAYIDVNENCASPITGNTYCAGNSVLKMSAPAGFKEYYWYDESFSTVLGNSNNLTISPAPPNGTRYALRIVPYPGLGCEDTLYTTVNALQEVLKLQVQDTLKGCASGVSLKADELTAGSSPNLRFTYFTDPDAENYVPDPANITASGTYYIKAENAGGCTDIKPIYVDLRNSPSIIITNPDPVCYPDKVDLTQPKITAGTTFALTYSYWKDAEATIPLNQPNVVDSSGNYYIKAVNPLGCSSVAAVAVVVGKAIKMAVQQNVSGCSAVNLTVSAITAGSDPGLSFSYYSDAAATQALTAPQAVNRSGTYYIKASSAAGCYTVMPVSVQVFLPPVFSAINPAPVVFPATVDLKTVVNGSDSLTYSYWKDAAATITLDNYISIQKTGTYYIKAVNKAGCSLILPVLVTINPPPIVKIIAPNTFTPNADGTNDLFSINYEGVLQISYFRIFNRYGQQVFETKQLSNFWDGTFNGSKIPLGTYYWVLDGADTYRKERVTRSGSVTVIR
ncbi:MAG: gliding motility-associated C-terminal domain-containing protein [Sphingobacteriaceae bacterium]|nr:MAG: gliding motility-associated C-terminal domain-containing protein [Sphingobacteriaceae bacterium]